MLEAGLEVLHEQSNEWLNEIAFWQDEIAFFYALIVKKTLKSVPIVAKNDIVEIENELTEMTTGGELDQLQKKVEQHECYLSNLLDNKSENKELYRTKHKELTLEFDEFEKRLKSLKKEVFKLIKHINKNKN
jgi:hypothetical protein